LAQLLLPDANRRSRLSFWQFDYTGGFMMIKKILTGEKGQGLVEYALILVLVAIVVMIILALLGPAIGNVFSNIVAAIGNPGGGASIYNVGPATQAGPIVTVVFQRASTSINVSASATSGSASVSCSGTSCTCTVTGAGSSGTVTISGGGTSVSRSW
jgi:pilus assembly protein Flp/PilA